MRWGAHVPIMLWMGSSEPQLEAGGSEPCLVV